MINLSV